MNVEVLDVLRDEGTVVVFAAETDAGQPIAIAVDHRSAQAITDALWDEDRVYAQVEPWQVLGQRGQGLAEYALLLGLIAIVAIVALLFLGGQINATLSTVGKSV